MNGDSEAESERGPALGEVATVLRRLEARRAVVEGHGLQAPGARTVEPQPSESQPGRASWAAFGWRLGIYLTAGFGLAALPEDHWNVGVFVLVAVVNDVLWFRAYRLVLARLRPRRRFPAGPSRRSGPSRP